MVSGEEDWTLVARLKAKYGTEWLALAATEDGELKLEKMSQLSIEPDAHEVQTWDTLLSTLVNNMNRIRHQIVTLAGVDWGDAEPAVLKSLFNANTILKADIDDTPVALTVAAARIVGRKATGGIVAMTADELTTLLALVIGDININADLVMGAHSITLAAGQTVDGVDISEITDVPAMFDANTILKADSDDTPIKLTVAEQCLVGRITAGVITALTAAQVKTMLDTQLSDISIDADLAMGAHSITLAAGQTVDGIDVSGIETARYGIVEATTSYSHVIGVAYDFMIGDSLRLVRKTTISNKLLSVIQVYGKQTGSAAHVEVFLRVRRVSNLDILASKSLGYADELSTSYVWFTVGFEDVIHINDEVYIGIEAATATGADSSNCITIKYDTGTGDGTMYNYPSGVYTQKCADCELWLKYTFAAQYEKKYVP